MKTLVDQLSDEYFSFDPGNVGAGKVKNKVGFTIRQVHAAARRWYGSTDIDSCCLAENRLMRGETYV